MRWATSLVVRGPKRCRRDIGKRVERRRRNVRNVVDRLGPITVTEEIFASHIKRRSALEISGPIGRSDRSAAHLIVLDRVLINGGVNQTEIIHDSTGLRTLARAEKARNGNRSEKGDDRDDDHDFDKGKGSPIIRFDVAHNANFYCFYLHCVSSNCDAVTPLQEPVLY